MIEHWKSATFEEFLDALQKTETGSYKDRGEGVLGDNGAALGPLQIHKCAWKDAMEFLGEKHLPYSYCAYFIFSKLVAYLYFMRYGMEFLRSGKWDCLARIWNGGPDGYLQQETVEYWNRCKSHLTKIVKSRLGVE